jgi:aminopeptidase YwaD
MRNVDLEDITGMITTCQTYLTRLCRDISERPTGSPGNRTATKLLYDQLRQFNWTVESTRFEAMNWQEDGVDFFVDNDPIQAFPSPYSLGCDVTAELMAAGSLKELDDIQPAGKILLLHDDLAREQIMPKHFVFYNPPEHQQIISLLERKNPAALVCATARNPALAGGVDPFPLFEDGDFDIPSVYLTEETGTRLIGKVGTLVSLHSKSKRIPGESYNLVARKGGDLQQRIVISAHIDAKKGTPGAIDNATGVIVLLLMAELLRDYDQEPMIELAVLNGEDYFAASGQIIYLEQNQGKYNQIMMNINIDGAGYRIGPTAISLFDVQAAMEQRINQIIQDRDEFCLGTPWFQGDHSIFIQQGVPAVAITSKWFLDHFDQQTITHTPQDHPGIVDCQKLVNIAKAIQTFILDL